VSKARHLIRSAELSPFRWVFGSLATITIYFQTNLADPFNSPKLWILFIVAAWLVGYVVSFKKIIFEIKQLKISFYLALLFIFVALFSTAFTDFKYTAIFGENQRRNGFITYLSLSIIFLASMIVVRLFNIKRFYKLTSIIATVSAFYALLQTNGKDFVKWNNPYNSIIGTLGNPNFAASVMAIIGIIMFSVIFIKDFNRYFRIYAGIVSLLLLGLILRSDARQGLLAYILGVGIFLVIWIDGKNRKLGVLGLTIGVSVFIFAVAGMLQIGPLEKFLYKPSVSVRGYYWRAGLEMLEHHPLFGVGMDRYGSYFKQYREVGYPLSYGFDITSTNAHNTFIQLFATGGFFLGASYLLLNSYILTRAIVGLKNLTGNNKLLLAGIFSAWIAFHAQSLVSIDNIGIAIWGWVLGGSIIGLSVSSNLSPGEDKRIFLRKQNDVNIRRVITSSIVVMIPVLLVTFLYRGENNSYNARGSFNLEDEFIKSNYRDLQLKTINTTLIEPANKLTSALNLIQAGFTNEGILVLKKILAEDPRNLDAINGLALTSEQLNRIPDAITYREKMTKLDPWNAANYLALGKNYKAQGDFVKSKEILDKILSFASNHPIAQQAKTELVS